MEKIKIKVREVHDPTIQLLSIYSKGHEIDIPKRDLCCQVHYSIVHYSQDMETI